MLPKLSQLPQVTFHCHAEYQQQVAHHREAQTLVPRQLAVPDAERIARKKKRRRRRWERQQRAAAQQPVRVLEGYTAVPSPVAMLAPSFASKTGTDSYDDEEDYILDEESSSGEGCSHSLASHHSNCTTSMAQLQMHVQGVKSLHLTCVTACLVCNVCKHVFVWSASTHFRLSSK